MIHYYSFVAASALATILFLCGIRPIFPHGDIRRIIFLKTNFCRSVAITCCRPYTSVCCSSCRVSRPSHMRSLAPAEAVVQDDRFEKNLAIYNCNIVCGAFIYITTWQALNVLMTRSETLSILQFKTYLS